jgi:hypothetical protein
MNIPAVPRKPKRHSDFNNRSVPQIGTASQEARKSNGETRAPA